MPQKVKIIPKSQRTRNRIREHGEIMFLKMIIGNKFLVESMGNTWHNETWAGWFTEFEAAYQKIDDK